MAKRESSELIIKKCDKDLHTHKRKKENNNQNIYLNTGPCQSPVAGPSPNLWTKLSIYEYISLIKIRIAKQIIKRLHFVASRLRRGDCVRHAFNNWLTLFLCNRPLNSSLHKKKR